MTAGVATFTCAHCGGGEVVATDDLYATAATWWSTHRCNEPPEEVPDRACSTETPPFVMPADGLVVPVAFFETGTRLPERPEVEIP